MSKIAEIFKSLLANVQVQQTQNMELATNGFTLPFDFARAQYALAVQLGLLESSMLASRDFAKALYTLEGQLLGSWARRR